MISPDVAGGPQSSPGKFAMFAHWISVLLKWFLALALLGSLVFAAYWINAQMRAERIQEGDEDKVQSPRRTKAGVVHLGVEAAERYGLQEEPVRAVSWSERVPVYGQVIPNPKATVEVRSPYAGTLRATAEAAWPAPGHWVRSGQVLGWVDIRVSAQERLTLLDNLANARLKKEGAEKVVQLQRERVNRIERVSRSQIVPGQQLDDAKVLLAEAETQLAIATAAVELWKKALDEVDQPGDRQTSTYSQALAAPADGEVTELAARPGMAIEAGGLIVQLVDFCRPLVRLDIPREILAAGPPPRLQLWAIPAHPPALSGVLDPSKSPETVPPMEATLVGPAPRVDAASQFIGYWYTPDVDRSEATAEETGSGSREGNGPGTAWRPGLMVKGQVTPPAARAEPAVAVPAGAVLFHQGRSLVYVRVQPGGYQRREVRLLDRDADSWVLARRQGSGLTGLGPGEIVVRNGAQVLLSEEFRSDVESD
jgi:hypothetical protein